MHTRTLSLAAAALVVAGVLAVTPASRAEYLSPLALGTGTIADAVSGVAVSDSCAQTCPTFTACTGTDVTADMSWTVHDSAPPSTGSVKSAQFSLTATDALGSYVSSSNYAVVWSSSDYVGGVFDRASATDNTPHLDLPAATPYTTSIAMTANYWDGPATGSPASTTTSNVVIAIAPCTADVRPTCVAPTAGDFDALVSGVSDSMIRMQGTGLTASSQQQYSQLAQDSFTNLVNNQNLNVLCNAVQGQYVTSTSFTEAQLNTIYLGVSWTTPGNTHQKLWPLDMQSGTLGASTTDTYTSAQDTPDAVGKNSNQAGFDLCVGSNCIVNGLKGSPTAGQLLGAQGDIVVPTVSAAPASQAPINKPNGWYVDSDISIWTGLTGTITKGGLAQTGIAIDATKPAQGNYNVFYEYIDTSGSGSRLYYGGNPTVPAGHYLWMSVTPQSNGKVSVGTNDLTARVGWSNSITPNSGWTPRYAWYVAEAPKISETNSADGRKASVIQQFPSLSRTIDFYDADFCTSADGYCYSFWDTANAGNRARYMDLQLQQSTSCGCNTAESVTPNTYAGFWGDAGYGTVSRVTSNYDWKQVNPSIS